MTTQKMTIQEYRASKKKKPKYHNKKVIVDGIEFDSIREGNRYVMLRLMEKAGGISDLKLQQWFILEVNGRVVCRYKADFTYLRDGKKIVEDTKGYRTEIYRLKCKLMWAVHGIEILET